MNTRTHSTRAQSGATTNTNLDALDALDLADHYVEAIQIVSANEVHGKVIDALATAVQQQNDQIRAILSRRAGS